jgi:predicted RNA binding protein YcfA (HicA-like mRNA interferase family)
MKVRDVIKLIEDDGWHQVAHKREAIGNSNTR